MLLLITWFPLEAEICCTFWGYSLVFRVAPDFPLPAICAAVTRYHCASCVFNCRQMCIHDMCAWRLDRTANWSSVDWLILGNAEPVRSEESRMFACLPILHFVLMHRVKKLWRLHTGFWFLYHSHIRKELPVSFLGVIKDLESANVISD